MTASTLSRTPDRGKCDHRVDVPDGVETSRFQRELDRLASVGRQLDVWVRGRVVGLDDQPLMVRINEFGEIVRDDTLTANRDGARSLIDPSAITVVHYDPFTGVVLDPTSQWQPVREPLLIFATFEQAKDYCRDVVRRFPHLECAVVGPGLPRWKYRDEAWVTAEWESRKASILWSRRLDVIMPILVRAGAVVLGLATFGAGWLLLCLLDGVSR